MLEIKDSTVLNRAIEAWGHEAQYLCAVEECSELVQAICKHINRSASQEAIIEETADVFIMLMQVVAMTNEEAVQQVVDKKLMRLEERLNKA